MAEQFPLPRSSFKLLRLILIGYLHEGGKDRKSSGPSQVGRAVGLDQTLVSRNNAPLAALGILERGDNRGWRLTEGGEMVARALEYEAPDEVRESLSELLRTNEYVQRVVTFVRSRGGLEEEQVVSQMALTAGVRKTSEFMTGARALLELMYAGGLVELDGDTVRVPTRQGQADPQKPSQGQPSKLRIIPSAGVDPSPVPSEPVVTLRVNLSAADLKTDAAADKLAARIKRLLAALAQD